MEEENETRRQTAGPEKGSMEEIRVTVLPAECLGEAAGLLARCFHANPNFVDLFPSQRARSRVLPRMFTTGLRDASGFGHVYSAMREVRGATGDDVVGVAVWLPASAFPLSPARQLRALPRMAGVLSAAPRSAAILRLVQDMKNGQNTKNGELFASASAQVHDYVAINGMFLPSQTRRDDARVHQ